MSEEYKRFSELYDLFHQKKDYSKETKFLRNILEKYNSKKILDVGCGTGRHIELLEKQGYECTGLDINPEMINIAKKRTKANFIIGDMSNFSLNNKFDAIISMFASFNHIIEQKKIENSLKCFFNHLNPYGILILDLHNPLTNGKKIDKIKNYTREMSWTINPVSKLEETTVKFHINGKVATTSHRLKIYSKEEINKFLLGQGFNKTEFFENYELKKATNKSKNMEVLALK